jgi:hypothetical protein
MAEHYPFMMQNWILSCAGQTVFLPYCRICIRSRRLHPGTPMDPFRPPPFFFQHNTFPLNRDQRIASYSLSPVLMVWAVSDIILSLLAARLCQTPGLQFGPSVLLHCLITYSYTIKKCAHNLSLLRWKKHIYFTSWRKKVLEQTLQSYMLLQIQKVGRFWEKQDLKILSECYI